MWLCKMYPEKKQHEREKKHDSRNNVVLEFDILQHHIKLLYTKCFRHFARVHTRFELFEPIK